MKLDQETKERLQRDIENSSRDGRLACALALQLADDYEVPPRAVGDLAGELGIKIVACQLGCF